MTFTLRLALLACCCLVLTTPALRAAATQPYAVGAAFAGFETKDQHDKPFRYTGGARRVVVSFEMDTGKAANAFLEKQPADYLARNDTLFIANIHGMPGIARTFAMPKMRRYPHRILLADAEDFLARYPQKENHLTVLLLDGHDAITAIRFVAKKEAAAAFTAP